MRTFTFKTTTRWTAAIAIPLMIAVGTLSLASIPSMTYGASIFYKPSGVAVNSGGYVFVIDNYNARILKFEPNTSYPDTSFIRQWGSHGVGEGQFSNPSGIAIDSSNNVYVAEIGNNRIQKFSNTGDFIDDWGSICRMATGENCSDPDGINGPLSKGDGQFYNPAGITIDKFDNVYVADSGNHRIQKFTNTGKFLGKWGGFGSGNGQFKFPMDITIDPNGYAYVTDRDNNRIQKFIATFAVPNNPTLYGVFVGKWGTYGPGDKPFKFKGPVGIDIDGYGLLYVTDSGNNRVIKFSTNGDFDRWWGTKGNIPTQFDYPRGIAVGYPGDVYVVDMNNHRVQKFTVTGEFISLWGPYPPASYGMQEDHILSASYKMQDKNHFTVD